jgi:membrane protease subunit HflC
MTRTQRPVVIAIGAVFALIMILSSLYTVHQTQQALVLQFGEPAAVVTEPGLHVRRRGRSRTCTIWISAC